jgi:conjugal transfer pilus assembly protein TraB
VDRLWDEVWGMSKRKQIDLLKETLSKNPKKTALYGGLILLVGLWFLWPAPSAGQEGDVTGMPVSVLPVTSSQVTDSLETAVDPRHIWAENLRQEMKVLDNKVAQKDMKLLELTQEMQHLRDAQLRAAEAETIRVLSPVPLEEEVKEVSIKTLGHMSQVFSDGKSSEKNPENYVASGSFARALLMTGVVAETGVQATSEPQPILLRLVDHGIFSKGYKTDQITDAILIGSCHGNISSERAICRLETISLMNKEETLLEMPVEGWLIGEDGRPGVKGDVVDKATDMARMAVLNGILGGIAGFFQNQATSSVYPISPLTGQSNALKGMDALKAGGASGVGNALTKLADYAIKRAEQMNPVIVVGSGRVIDVVFKKGFSLEKDGGGDESKNNIQHQAPPKYQEMSVQVPEAQGPGMQVSMTQVSPTHQNEGVF